MNPNNKHLVSAIALVKSIWINRQLIWIMTKREVIGRYKGSIMGLTWSLFNPMLMLGIYTFVFSVVFKTRWGTSIEDSKTQFAIVLFIGLIIHRFFADVVGSASSLVLSNVNYVKKVIFPLEVLPVIITGAALFNAMISFVVLFIAYLIFNGFLHWTIIFIPIVLFPFVLATLGLAWMLSSIGVFIRDVEQPIEILVMIMLFISGVFFPIAALPDAYQPWLRINILAFIIEQAREIIVYGNFPDFLGLSICASVGIATAWIGFAWFQKTRKGFADVL